MAMQNFLNKPYSRTTLVVYAAALLVVLGTWVASRYLIVQRFERIEQRDMAQTLAVLRKSLLAQNTAVETLSRDYARWDEMYNYVTALDPTFEGDNFSQQGLDEANVELVWLLNPRGEIVSSFQNDTAAERYDHPVRPEMAKFLASLNPAIKAIADAQGTLRLLQIDGALHVVAAHSILHSDRTGPPAGTLVFTRAIGAAEMREIATAAQTPATLLLADAIASNTVPDLPPLAARLIADSNSPASLMLGTSQQRMAGATRLVDIDGRPIAVMATHRDRDVMQSGLRGANYLVAFVALLIALALFAWHVYSRRLRASSAAARVNQARYRAVFERTPTGVLLFNHQSQVILDANIGAQRMLGAPLPLLQQHRVSSLFDGEIALAPTPAGTQEQDGCLTAQIARADGAPIDVEFAVVEIEPLEDNVRAMIMRDISHRREAERRAQEHRQLLQHQATHDQLTGLPNRAYLEDHLPRLIDEVGRRGGSLAVFYIDCDHFKNINDTRGHHVGDEYLRSVARRIRSTLATDDLVVRMGGDEFLVVTRQNSNEPVTDTIAARLSTRLKEPTQLGSATYSMSASIGISTFPRDANSMTDLLRAADIALYEAKSRGRDRHQHFDAAMHKRVHARLSLEQDLRIAVEQDAIGIHLQPLFDMRSGRIVSFEALARWHHRLHGPVPPLSFIPVAEASDLIVQLGENVLRAAARLIAQWQEAGLDPVPIAANVSAKQLQMSDLSERILTIAEDFNVPPLLIGIELTESVAMHDSAQHVAKLHALRDLGMRVSVDDFGTGYSSLSYLRNLPIDTLKIDRSFVRDMNIDNNDAAIVRAIIGMAQSLNLTTVAEGIESREQASQLLSLGCSVGQGYYFAKPMPAESTFELLRHMQLADTMPNRRLAAG